MELNTQKEWNDEAIVIPPTESIQFSSHGNVLKVVIPTTLTGNQYGVYDIFMDAKARGPKLHYHKMMDETFIVNEGTLTVLTATGHITATKGTVIHIPKLAVHGYNNDSEEAVKMTMIFHPGENREEFFKALYQMLEENPDDVEAFNQLYAQYDSYPLNETDMVPLK